MSSGEITSSPAVRSSQCDCAAHQLEHEQEVEGLLGGEQIGLRELGPSLDHVVGVPQIKERRDEERSENRDDEEAAPRAGATQVGASTLRGPQQKY